MDEILEITSKVCSKCFVEKPLEAFYKEKAGKFGVRGDCKCCVNERNAEYYTNPENRARRIEWYTKPENKEKLTQWYENNKDVIAERNAKPENKARQAEYDAKPERKAKRVEYDAKPVNKIKKLEYEAKCRKSNPLYKLRCNIRSLIIISIKSGGFKKIIKNCQNTWLYI